MIHAHGTRWLRALAAAVAMTLTVVGASVTFAADISGPFAGKAVNGGTVTHEMREGKHVLVLSSDFPVPGSPDPHWQIVDSRGTTYLLNRLKLKDDRISQSIEVPAYITDIARVQMWCAWAEVVLGEASFAHPVMAHAAR